MVLVVLIKIVILAEIWNNAFTCPCRADTSLELSFMLMLFWRKVGGRCYKRGAPFLICGCLEVEEGDSLKLLNLRWAGVWKVNEVLDY